MQSRWANWLCVAGLALTGCASTHIYALPASGAQGQSTFDPLVACAGARNLQSQRQPNGVDIKVDDGSFIRFALDDSGQYGMGTMLDDAATPKGERKAKLQMLKDTGDALYACATQPGGPPAQASAAPAQGVAPVQGAAPPASEACDRLDRCYVEIATSLCEARDPHCKDHFHSKIHGDPTACQVTLQNLPMMIAPMQRAKPNWQMPAVCLQDGVH